MGKAWTFLTQVHTVAGPVLMLLYPLYASVVAIESTSKLDDEQWLAYWIIYSFLTLVEMLLQPALEWLPIWYNVKLVFVAWLVLPQFKGAAFLYERYVRDQVRKYGGFNNHPQYNHPQSSNTSPTGKAKNKFVQFMNPKTEAY
ncbi:HVA22-like protein e isoform X2 [Pyrus x bretschneideri]|uniref:HVA22-like protein e isoform X2 n=1 Tax=Pyrus x bretschneideri TaxID=225117 RepID=UPI00202EB3E4|nr:HVA22-like protein e isoform X2 [Pyrus x bretschneideri]